MRAAQFPNHQPNHYIFPFEKYGANGEEDSFGFTAGVVIYDADPTRPIGDWKEAWEKAKERARRNTERQARRIRIRAPEMPVPRSSP